MEARFSPLALPTILHDLPHNYAQRISLYDGDGNFTTRQHADRFDDFIDLEEVDDDDIKIRLFAQSFSGEENKWFRYLPSRLISTFESFRNAFLERWDDKESPL